MKKSTFRLFSLFALGGFAMPMAIGCTSDDQHDKSNNDPDASDPAEETTEEVIEVVKSDFEIYPSNSITPSSCNYALKSADGTPVRATFRGVYKIQQFGELEYKFYFSFRRIICFLNNFYIAIFVFTVCKMIYIIYTICFLIQKSKRDGSADNHK